MGPSDRRILGRRPATCHGWYTPNAIQLLGHLFSHPNMKFPTIQTADAFKTLLF